MPTFLDDSLLTRGLGRINLKLTVLNTASLKINPKCVCVFVCFLDVCSVWGVLLNLLHANDDQTFTLPRKIKASIH